MKRNPLYSACDTFIWETPNAIHNNFGMGAKMEGGGINGGHCLCRQTDKIKFWNFIDIDLRLRKNNMLKILNKFGIKLKVSRILEKNLCLKLDQ